MNNEYSGLTAIDVIQVYCPVCLCEENMRCDLGGEHRPGFVGFHPERGDLALRFLNWITRDKTEAEDDVYLEALALYTQKIDREKLAAKRAELQRETYKRLDDNDFYASE